MFEKATLIRAGGYLTPFVRHRIVEEYVGPGAGTVCEDMEIVVRLHRYVRDKGLDRRIAFLPHPVAWTEVPETFESLRKQRGRWYRGLREALRYHRAMLGRRPFGRIGWFALPAFWLFEYLGPLIEVAGYALVLFLFVVEKLAGGRALDPAYSLGIPARFSRIWDPGQCRRRPGRRVAVPRRPGRPSPAPAAAVRRLERGLHSAGLCGAREFRVPPIDALLALSRLVGCLAGENGMGEVRTGRLQRGIGGGGACLSQLPALASCWSTTTPPSPDSSPASSRMQASASSIT